MDLVAIAREKAEESLARCLSPVGIKAAAAYYPQVWARDGVIASFGALLVGRREFTEAVRAGLAVLARCATPLGHVPNFVPVREDGTAAEGGGVTNAVDSNAWFVIGHGYLLEVCGDEEFARDAWEAISRALVWLRYQDYNDCGLLEVHECSDWADLFPNRFNALCHNVLYFGALRVAERMAGRLGLGLPAELPSSSEVRDRLRTLFWLPPDEAARAQRVERLRAWNHEWALVYAQMSALWWERDYFLPYILMRIVGSDRFDTLGNLLAVLFGVAGEEEAGRILRYMHTRGLDEPFPVCACYPRVEPGDADWRDYFLNREYCRPGSAHNGGVWPFLGGFYVAALARAGMKEEALIALDRLAAANAQDDWSFNELLHGDTGRPIGARDQAWSSAMFIYAHEAVVNGRSPLVSLLAD